MAAGAVDDLLERFEKDAWFGKPQDRDLEVAGLDAWAKKEMLALGGPFTTHITYRTFVRVAQKFEELVFNTVTGLLKTHITTQNLLFQATTGPRKLERGYTLWLKRRPTAPAA